MLRTVFGKIVENVALAPTVLERIIPMPLLETILGKMSTLSKPQKNFQGRANYANLGRHSGLSEKAYCRWFGKKLDFIWFNCIGNAEIIPAMA